MIEHAWEKIGSVVSKYSANLMDSAFSAWNFSENCPPPPWKFPENSSKFETPIVPKLCELIFRGEMCLWGRALSFLLVLVLVSAQVDFSSQFLIDKGEIYSHFASPSHYD